MQSIRSTVTLIACMGISWALSNSLPTVAASSGPLDDHATGGPLGVWEEENRETLSDPSVAMDNASLAWDAPRPIERFRRGFFQGVELAGGALLDTGSRLGGLDQSYWEASASFGVPLGSFTNILAVSPFFRADHLAGPTELALPETLYSTGVNLFHRKEWTPRISTTVLLAPSVRSDFTTSQNAFRLFGLGLINYQSSPSLKWSLGAVYFDRADLGVLPAVGLTWTPREDLEFEFLMPRPRFRKRLWRTDDQAEAWLYAGASIGGNTWAISQDVGASDTIQLEELTLSGLRSFVGYEVIRAGNRGLRVEGGIVFRRDIELEQQALRYKLDNALFVEAAWKF